MHVPFEGPAGIGVWSGQHGHSMTLTRLYAGETPPGQDDFDRLFVMGGPMGIYDEQEHPWLVPEKRFIAETIAAGKTVVGVCLGAQLIADVLGARVRRNPQKEIGWFPIELSESACESAITGFLPPSLEVFHWHGDTFDLPEGAVHLASSDACRNQAYLYEGRVLGLQFHIESTPKSVTDIVANCADELVPAERIQTAERILSATAEDYARINSALFGILDRLPG
ncbi:Glutamine amidotransferase class-I [Imhoffiella purpurea]|uniref:Glutamine amidotransferase class-I n=2 Tax=Imhoffiella purpurea TaxID=1249627 RepID=W9VAV2_9GAMM|nr:Glutamine amidotransferase class-I [Imhoffiella purpurea]